MEIELIAFTGKGAVLAGRLAAGLEGLGHRCRARAFRAFPEAPEVPALEVPLSRWAREAGIAFQASAVVPEQLPIPDTDLCALLLNLFDNALAGASRAPAGRETARAVRPGQRIL